jgi:phosphopantothenoylcysteine decarboxylase/phosphopantothenate--cysteine ligase
MQNENTNKYLSLGRVLIGGCGSIAVSFLPAYVSWMRYAAGISEVRIILTRQATRMVSVDALTVITEKQVFVDQSPGYEMTVPHLQLMKSVDLFLILPATANMLSKAANGIADDLISTCILGADIPVFFVPSMNDVMWNKPSIQRNIKLLREDGYHVIEPREGYEVATGKKTFGTMPDMPTTLAEVQKTLSQLEQQS